MALLTLRPDNSWLVETRLDYFLDRWRSAPQKDKLVLDDKRPAVRSQDELGVSLLTVHPEAWDRVRRKIQPILQQGKLDHPSKKRLCEFCGTELKLRRELTDCWVFYCVSCDTAEIHAKYLVGGTEGAGNKEKL
jgi:hypothetical protein